jgi:hypothetical protein
MLQEILLDLLLRTGACAAQPCVPGLLLQFLTVCLAGPVTEVFGQGCDKCLGKLSPPSLTQSLLLGTFPPPTGLSIP